MMKTTIKVTMLAIAVAGGWGAIPSPAAAATRHAVAPVQHSRVIPLQGGRNFRDLGGYRAADGRHVVWGKLFRSGSMHGLTPADYTALEARGIRTVCDFRDSKERAAEPVAWPTAAAPRVLADDYVLDMAGLMPPGKPLGWTAEQTSASMTASYPRMLTQFNSQYRRMFAELLAGHAPLAFNCSAGKDRTGIAAALLLTALGVPRATVIEDYLLTNQTLHLDGAMAASQASGSFLAQLPPAIAHPFMIADRRYIEAALAVVDGHQGGAQGYLRDELGLSPADIAHLRRTYLN